MEIESVIFLILGIILGAVILGVSYYIHLLRTENNMLWEKLAINNASYDEFEMIGQGGGGAPVSVDGQNQFLTYTYRPITREEAGKSFSRNYSRRG